jgi:hypothetical protein
MRVDGVRRKLAALGVLGVLAGSAWLTMEDGRPRWLVAILLGGFALRILLSSAGAVGNSQPEPGSRYDKSGGE